MPKRAIQQPSGQRVNTGQPVDRGQRLHMSRHVRTWWPVLIVAAGAAAYGNSLGGAFVFDDRVHILDSKSILDLGNIGQIVLTSRRPVVNLTLAINYALGGHEPFGYHVFNMAVHVTAALVLFGLVRRTLRAGRFDEGVRSSADRLAAAVALIWVVHPLNTQAVTYVIQRGESMCGLCYLLTLYCVVRGVGAGRRRTWNTAAIVACALGMGCKAVMVTAPVAVLLYDWVFLSRSVAGALRERWGLYAGLAGTWSILVAVGEVRDVLLSPAGLPTSVGFGVPDSTAWTYALTQAGVILQYLRISVWPHPLSLDWGWPIVTGLRDAWPSVLAILLLLAVTGWAVWRRSWAGFAGAWFFLVLAPTSSVIPILDAAFEHRMYLSLAGLVALTVGSAWGLLRRARRRFAGQAGVSSASTLQIAVGKAGMLITALAVATLVAVTAKRNRDYATPISIWQSALRVNPNNPRAHNNLGHQLHAADRPEEAVAHLRLAVALKPSYAEAHLNLGVALDELGQTEEATRAYKRALELRPDDGRAWHNLGAALFDLGRPHESVRCYQRALTHQPDLVEAHNNLAGALVHLGNLEQAIPHFARTIELDPLHAQAHYNLGVALGRLGRQQQAMSHYQRAVELQPEFLEARYNLANALCAQQRWPEAVQHYRRIVTADATFANAREKLRQAQQRVSTSMPGVEGTSDAGDTQ